MRQSWLCLAPTILYTYPQVNRAFDVVSPQHQSSRQPGSPQQRTQLRQPKESNPAPRHSDAPTKHSTSTSNASAITTWPPALRHVMRTVGQNEETQLRIRGLIRSQHTHEQQWWRNREALVSRQQSRGEKKKELDAVLYVSAITLSSPNLVPELTNNVYYSFFPKTIYRRTRWSKSDNSMSKHEYPYLPIMNIILTTKSRQPKKIKQNYKPTTQKSIKLPLKWQML